MSDQSPETHGTPPGGDASLTTERNASVSGLSFADDNADDGAATLSDLQGQACPNCTVGVLYVTRYDPQAIHEQGENAKLLTEESTGGGYEVNCFHCHFHESRPLPRETEEQANERKQNGKQGDEREGGNGQ